MSSAHEMEQPQAAGSDGHRGLDILLAYYEQGPGIRLGDNHYGYSCGLPGRAGLGRQELSLMPLFLLTLLKGKSLRYLLLALMFLSVGVGAYVIYNKIWSDGYTTARTEYQVQLLEETQRAVALARIEWAASEAVAAELLEKERRTNEVINDVISKIPDAVSSSGCDRLGDDVLRLFNRAIEGGGADSSGGISPGVPGT